MVCFVSYASQPDIQFHCDGDWDIPAWEQPKDLPTNVHLATDGRLYTFDEEFVDCPLCMRKIIVKVFQEKKAHGLEFHKGYVAGSQGAKYSPTSPAYTEGFLKGKRMRKLIGDDT